MRNDGIFEKARMNGILIPVAGAVIAAALVLFAVFTAAYFGAFTTVNDEETSRQVEFEEPDKPTYGFHLKPNKGDAASMTSDVRINIISFVGKTFETKNDGIGYEIGLINQSDTPATVVDLRCMLYKDDICIGSSIISSGLLLDEKGKYVNLSGTEKTKDADTVVFYVQWEEESGAQQSTYASRKIGRY